MSPPLIQIDTPTLPPAAADLASGVEPIVDARPYHPSRFNDTAWGKVANF